MMMDLDRDADDTTIDDVGDMSNTAAAGAVSRSSSSSSVNNKRSYHDAVGNSNTTTTATATATTTDHQHHPDAQQQHQQQRCVGTSSSKKSAGGCCVEDLPPEILRRTATYLAPKDAVALGSSTTTVRSILSLSRLPPRQLLAAMGGTAISVPPQATTQPQVPPPPPQQQPGQQPPPPQPPGPGQLRPQENDEAQGDAGATSTARSAATTTIKPRLGFQLPSYSRQNSPAKVRIHTVKTKFHVRIEEPPGFFQIGPPQHHEGHIWIVGSSRNSRSSSSSSSMGPPRGGEAGSGSVGMSPDDANIAGENVLGDDETTPSSLFPALNNPRIVYTSNWNNTPQDRQRPSLVEVEFVPVEDEIYQVWYKMVTTSRNPAQIHLILANIKIEYLIFENNIERLFGSNYRTLLSNGVLKQLDYDLNRPPYPVAPISSESFFTKLLLSTCKSLRIKVIKADNDRNNVNADKLDTTVAIDDIMASFFDEYNIPKSSGSLQIIEDIIETDMLERKEFRQIMDKEKANRRPRRNNQQPRFQRPGGGGGGGGLPRGMAIGGAQIRIQVGPNGPVINPNIMNQPGFMRRVQVDGDGNDILPDDNNNNNNNNANNNGQQPNAQVHVHHFNDNGDGGGGMPPGLQNILAAALGGANINNNNINVAVGGGGDQQGQRRQAEHLNNPGNNPDDDNNNPNDVEVETVNMELDDSNNNNDGNDDGDNNIPPPPGAQQQQQQPPPQPQPQQANRNNNRGYYAMLRDFLGGAANHEEDVVDEARPDGVVEENANNNNNNGAQPQPPLQPPQPPQQQHNNPQGQQQQIPQAVQDDLNQMNIPGLVGNIMNMVAAQHQQHVPNGDGDVDVDNGDAGGVQAEVHVVMPPMGMEMGMEMFQQMMGGGGGMQGGFGGAGGGPGNVQFMFPNNNNNNNFPNFDHENDDIPEID